MQISQIYKEKKQPLSLEIFPPKGDLSIENAISILNEICFLKPDFISVTRTDTKSPDFTKTIKIASIIKNSYNIESVAHLTCINNSKEVIRQALLQLRERHVENILALLGNLPDDYVPGDYSYASELIADIDDDYFCVGGACYPEGHIDADSLEADLEYIKLKQELGARFFISQLFFDNDTFYRFIEKARSRGITCPISAGIMPILSQKQISKMIFTCGVSLPGAIVRLLNKYSDSPEELRKAGIEYANRQMREVLSNTDCGVHIFIMNHPEIAQGLLG